MIKVAQLKIHQKPWCKSASLLLAHANEVVNGLNIPLPGEIEPPAPYWPGVMQTFKQASLAVTTRKKKGIFTTFFHIDIEGKVVKCFKMFSDKEPELFFEIGPADLIL